MVEEKLEEYQCGFRLGRNTSDQLLTLRLILERSWEFDQPIFACVVDLENAYDRVPREKLWEVLITYGIEGLLLGAIRSLYRGCRSCVRLNDVKSENFTVIVELRQGYMLFLLLFLIYMNWMLQRSRDGESFFR